MLVLLLSFAHTHSHTGKLRKTLQYHCSYNTLHGDSQLCLRIVFHQILCLDFTEKRKIFFF